MKVSVGFEAQVQSRLGSAVLEGYYIPASLLGPSSGVGTPQMFLEVQSSIVVLLLAHHSLFGEQCLEPHILFEGLSGEHHSLDGLSSGVGTPQMWMQAPHRQAEGLLLEPHSLSVGLFLEPNSLFVELLLVHHTLFEELSVEPHSLDEPADQLRLSYLLHQAEVQGGV